MRKILTLIFVVAFSLPMWTANYNTICVNLIDGSQVKITMTETLRITFSESDLIATGMESDVTVSKADIVNFTHVYAEETGIDDIVNGSNFTFANGVMAFSSLPAGSVIAVYDLSGKTVFHEVAGGEYMLALDRFPKGLYIVTVNNVSYKINNK